MKCYFFLTLRLEALRDDRNTVECSIRLILISLDNLKHKESATFHGQLEEKATLEDEQAQAPQAHESEPSQEAGLGLTLG